jgi:hypothetical protein
MDIARHVVHTVTLMLHGVQRVPKPWPEGTAVIRALHDPADHSLRECSPNIIKNPFDAEASGISVAMKKGNVHIGSVAAVGSAN